LIFVTGGTGFLGSYILQELVARGEQVRALRHASPVPFYLPASIAEKVEWVQGDLLDVDGLTENLRGVRRIIHAGGMVSFYPPDKKKLFSLNIDGTANLVNAAIENGVRDFVYISSVAAMGRDEMTAPMNEEKKWPGNKHQTNYAISKYLGEMEVWRGMGEGLDALIVNPATLLGYGDWNQSSCGLFKMAYREFPWYMEGTNGFADVSDTARAILQLADSGIRNEKFIISAENRSYLDLFRVLAKGFGKKPPSQKAGPVITGFAWRVERLRSVFRGKKPLLTRESAGIASRKNYYDNSKLLKALPDFRFRPLEDSIFEACGHYLKNLQPV